MFPRVARMSHPPFNSTAFRYSGISISIPKNWWHPAKFNRFTCMSIPDFYQGIHSHLGV
jgi:hypothetical protein